MNALNVSGKDILRFLLNHYEFVQAAFAAAKPEFMLDAERLQSIIAAYNAGHTGSELTISRLTALKFCRQLPTGDYKLDTAYTRFLEFLFDDFVLNLPDTIKSRYQSILGHFRSLQTEKDEPKIYLFIQEIVREIDAFLSDIAGQTFRLLKDTESLKREAGHGADLTMRVKKASYWIHEYINPLNNILDRSHPDSIMAAIIEIQKYAGERRILADGYALKLSYEKLYASALSAKTELDGTLSRITRELLPLLERIKSDSMILIGFYHFVEAIDEPDDYMVPLPPLLRRTRQTVAGKTFGQQAAFYIGQFLQAATEAIYAEPEAEIEALPDPGYFKAALLEAKEVPDFYRWCYEALASAAVEPRLSSYLRMAGLVLEQDFSADYYSDERRNIELEDAILSLPKVRVYENLSARA